MSTSTNLTAEQLLELAFRTSRTCRERQRRTAVRAEEERARLAALHGRIDELERALNGADAKRAVHADAARSCASDLAAIAKAVGLGDACEPTAVLLAVREAIAERDAMAEPCCECRQLREQRDEARASLAVAVAKRSPCCGCAVRCGRCGSEFARTEEEATRIAEAEKRAHVEALSHAETKSAGADVIVADAEARRVAAEHRAIAAEARAERLERENVDAEVRGALAVFRAVVRAEEEGRVIPVPLDERVWPSVAAEICAEARAKGGE